MEQDDTANYIFKLVIYIHTLTTIDKGLIIPCYTGNHPIIANEMSNVRVLDFQADPMFTYIDSKSSFDL